MLRLSILVKVLVLTPCLTRVISTLYTLTVLLLIRVLISSHFHFTHYIWLFIGVLATLIMRLVWDKLTFLAILYFKVFGIFFSVEKFLEARNIICLTHQCSQKTIQPSYSNSTGNNFVFMLTHCMHIYLVNITFLFGFVCWINTLVYVTEVHVVINIDGLWILVITKTEHYTIVRTSSWH